jgi:hypothetical protein
METCIITLKTGEKVIECPGCGAMIAVAHTKNCPICYLNEILAGGGDFK